jgi:hypothetical protein
MPLPTGKPSPSITLFSLQQISRPPKRLLSLLAALSFFLFPLFSSLPLQAQDSFGSEKELKSQAEKFFKDDDYASALSLYSQLLSLYPSDPNYNYKFGVCLLYATENKEKPLSYLIFGVGKEGVEDEAYYHLGRAFHLNYRFDEAIVQYSLYKTKAGGKAAAKLDVDRQIAMCNNGKSLLRNVTDLVVMERKEMNASEYFRAYDLGGLDAKLVVKPDDLASSYDKKKKEKSTVVVRQTSQEIYYSSYGPDGKSGRDIYKITRLPNFQWSKEENLGSVINTPFDEDYPYITPDGKTLYFSSKGHNSMGGYDVFKSEWDEQSKTWSKPVNLDFAINTPDDDVQYVTDPNSAYGFFSSKRSVPEGKITVYKIRTERIPPTISAIRGQFNCDFKPPQFKARISIKNLENGKFVGTIGTNEKTGVYRVNLNNGNKYEYTVESPGYAPITQVVEIPTMTEQRPLRQEIQLKKVNGEDQVQIMTFFADTAQDDASALARAEWLKDKAMLDVNADQVLTEGSGSPVAQKKDLGPDRNAYVEADFSKLKLDNNQLLKIAKDDVTEAQKDLDQLEEKTEKAYALADQKNKQAEEKNAQAKQYESEADKIAAGPLKEEKQAAALSAEKEAKQLTNEARVAMSIARQLEGQTREASTELDQAKKYEDDLAKAIQSDSKDALKALSEQAAKIQEENNAPEKESSTASNDISNRELLISKMKASNQKTEKEIDELEQDQVNLSESLKTVSDEQQKAAVQQELKEIEAQIKGKQKSIAQNNEKVVSYQNEIDQAIADERLAKQLNEQIEAAPVASITASDKAKIAEKTNNLVSTLPTETMAANSTAVEKTQGNNATENKEQAVAKTNNAQEKQVAIAEEKKEQGKEEISAQNSSESKTETTVAIAPVENKNNTTVENPVLAEQPASVAGNEGLNKTPGVRQLEEANRVNARIDSLSKAISTETDQSKMEAMIAESKALQEKELRLKVEGKTAAMESAKEKGNTQVASFKEKLETNRLVSENRAELVTKDINELQNRIAQSEEYFVKAAANTDLNEKDSLLTLSMNIMSSAEKKMNEIHVGNVDLFDAPPKLLPKIEEGPAKTEKVLAAEATSPTPQPKIAQASEAVRNNAIVKQYEPSMNYESNVKLSKEELEEVKSTTSYIQFESLLNKSQEYIAEGRKQAVVSEEIRARGQNKLMESQSLIEMAAEENNNKKQQMLAENAMDVDREGKDLIQDADSVKNIAVKEMRKAGAIKNEAEKVLNKLSKFERDQIIAAYILPEGAEEPAAVAVANPAGNKPSPNSTAKESSVEVKSAPENASTQKVNPAVSSGENSTASSSTENVVAAGNKEEKNNAAKVEEKNEISGNNVSGNETARSKENQTKQTEVQQNTAAGKNEGGNAAEKSTEVIAQNKTPETKTEGSTPAKSTANNTVAVNEPVTSKPNPSVAPTGNNNQSAAQLIAAEKSTPEYGAYSSFKDRVTSQEEQSKQFSQQADSVSRQATLAENNSSDLLEFAAAQRDKKKRKEAQEKAMVFDEESRLLREESSRLRTQAGAAKLESMRMQSSADSVLTASGEERASRMRMAYNNIVPTEESALAMNTSENNPTETKAESKSIEPTTTNGKAPAPKTAEAKTAENELALNQNAATNEEKTQKPTTPLTSEKKAENNTTSANTAQANNKPSRENKADGNEKAEQVKPSGEQSSGQKASTTTKQANGSEEKTKSTEAKENKTEVVQNQQKTEAPRPAPVHKTQEYIAYRSLMNQADSLNKEAALMEQKSATVRADADRSFEESNTLLEQAAGAKKKERKALIEQAAESENAAVRLRNEADSLSGRGNDLKAMARTKENAAALNLSRVDASLATRIEKTYKGLEDTTEVVAVAVPVNEREVEELVSNNKQAEKNTRSEEAQETAINQERVEAPDKTQKTASTFRESFSTNSKASPGSEIPMNPALPSGIVYKVQIGAFKRPLPGNAFGTVSPVAGETTNSGWIRYTAGLFSGFNKAQAAKGELNGRGFNDAFVVAYCNGQRISVSKAREMERNGTSCDGSVVIAKAENAGVDQSSETKVNVLNKGNKTAGSEENSVSSTGTTIALGAILPQTGLNEVKGLVYTIQIGVYRKMVTAGQLYNIQPLYYEQLDNGLYRYTTGVYNNLKDAGEAKNIAVGFGIQDAFITAYRGGKRITMDQAAALVAQNGQGVFDQREGMNRMPTQLKVGGKVVQEERASKTTETPKIDVTQKGSSNQVAKADVSQLFFKVQLGAFRNEVPVEVLNKFLAMAGKGISNMKSEDGLTIYLLGNFSSREEAQRLKETVAAEGIPDAFVIALYKGKRISMEEAAQIIQNK